MQPHLVRGLFRGAKMGGGNPFSKRKTKNPHPRESQEYKRMIEIDRTYTETKNKLRDELHEKIDKIFEIVDGEHTRELTITSRISLGHVQVEYEIKGGNITNI